MVGVKWLARAHVLSGEVASTKGRYVNIFWRITEDAKGLIPNRCIPYKSARRGRRQRSDLQILIPQIIRVRAT